MTLNDLTGRFGTRVSRLMSGSGLLVGYIVLAIFVARVDSRFFSWTNIENMLVQNAGLSLVVIGMTFVIISGAYDLSVGGIAGLSGVIFAKIAVDHSILLAGVFALAAGLACGLVNGFIVARLRVNSFMATFATGLAFVGLALELQGPQQISVTKSGFDALGRAKWGAVPEPIVLVVAAFLVGAVVLQSTRFGQNIYAVGGNREAARLVGIPVNRTWSSAFVVSGLMAALGGMVTASQLGLGSSDSGSALPIESIAAVVVGGISVYGGEGRIWRAALGLLILATLNNVFVALSWSLESQNVAEGVVILLALGANRVARISSRTSDEPPGEAPLKSITPVPLSSMGSNALVAEDADNSQHQPTSRR